MALLWTILLILSTSVLQIGEAKTANKCFKDNSRVIISTSIDLSCGPAGQISLVSAVLGVPTAECTVDRTIPCTLSSDIIQLPGVRKCNGLEECSANIFTRLLICGRIIQNISVEIVYDCISADERNTRLAPTDPTTSVASGVSASGYHNTGQLDSATSELRSTSTPETDDTPTLASEAYGSTSSGEGTNILIITMSTILAVLLMLVTVLVICMCRSTHKKTKRNVYNMQQTTQIQPHISQIRLSGTVNQYRPMPSPIKDKSTISRHQIEDTDDSSDHLYWELDQIPSNQGMEQHHGSTHTSANLMGSGQLRASNRDQIVDRVNLGGRAPVEIMNISRQGPSNSTRNHNIAPQQLRSGNSSIERDSQSTNLPEDAVLNDTFHGISASHRTVYTFISQRNHDYRSKPRREVRSDKYQHPRYAPTEADGYDIPDWDGSVMNRYVTDERYRRVHPRLFSS